MIDLHIHSTHSDGSDTPARLVELGRRAGLRAMALTDHDTMAGTEDFLVACRAHGMIGISGIEISVDVDGGSGSLHILGYGMDPHHPAIHKNLGWVLDGRAWRNERIVEKLNELGLELNLDEARAYVGEDVVARPHIARALVKRGYVSTVAEAFDKYLAKGRPAYIDRYRLNPEEGISMIRETGGIAVIAHPFTWENDDARLEAGLRTLQSFGLSGIEAIYSEYTPEQTVTLLRLAKRLGLLVTGGSDYHGLAKPDIALGRGFGALSVPDTCLPPLLAALGPDNPWVTTPP